MKPNSQTPHPAPPKPRAYTYTPYPTRVATAADDIPGGGGNRV